MCTSAQLVSMKNATVAVAAIAAVAAVAAVAVVSVVCWSPL